MSVLTSKWSYISEGNAHIVLQILGTNYVLRLIKEDQHAVNKDALRQSVDFVNLIMVPLIFGSYKYTEEVVKFTTEELNILNQQLVKVRPQNRIVRSTLSLLAIQAPNFVIISPNNNEISFSIEIKPKEGFVSSVFKDYNKCYYCLKQYLKLQQKQIQKTSEYCPCDLFSGNRKKMKYALLSLVNNPQNNMKIFKNGNIIFNDHSKSLDFCNIVSSLSVFGQSISLFLDFIIEILLGNENNNLSLNKSSNVPVHCKNNKLCDSNSILTPTNILYRILQLQKLSKETQSDVQNCKDDYSYVFDINKKLKTSTYNITQERDRKQFLSYLEPEFLALISAVAKDCSLMITFSLNSEESSPHVLVGTHKVPYRVSVTDLEPKPYKTLLKRRKTEEMLLEIYKAHLENSQCKIQPHTETRAKQVDAWQQLIVEYLKANKSSTIDIRESQNSPLFNNTAINRKLSQESILTILEDMAKSGKAAPIDKSKMVWEVYWHSLDEWGNIIYTWASSNGLNNTVCTLFELQQGDNTDGEEFHGLDMSVLLKALKALEVKGKCELMTFDDSQGVKFF